MELFLTNNKLKFNQIEKLLKIRSNKLNYHLKKLINKNIIEKNNNLYNLTETSEYLIPYISNKNSLLPVVLILIGNEKKSFLYKREKRPYKSKLSLPGGRVLLGESLEDAVKRIMKYKHNIKAEIKSIHSISLEQIKKSGKIIHSFLLILVSAKTEDKICFTEINTNKNKIISSDYNLIINDSRKKIEIKTINSKAK